MYIRKTISKSKKNPKKRYYTYRLVESIRIGEKVKQHTLLNLGADFSLDQSHWSTLSKRIDDILKGQPSLFELDQEIESLAQQYAAQLLSTKAAAGSTDGGDTSITYESVNLESLEHLDPKSIGGESLLYETIQKLKLNEALESVCRRRPHPFTPPEHIHSPAPECIRSPRRSLSVRLNPQTGA